MNSSREAGPVSVTELVPLVTVIEGDTLPPLTANICSLSCTGLVKVSVMCEMVSLSSMMSTPTCKTCMTGSLSRMTTSAVVSLPSNIAGGKLVIVTVICEVATPLVCIPSLTETRTEASYAAMSVGGLAGS